MANFQGTLETNDQHHFLASAVPLLALLLLPLVALWSSPSYVPAQFTKANL